MMRHFRREQNAGLHTGRMDYTTYNRREDQKYRTCRNKTSKEKIPKI